LIPFLHFLISEEEEEETPQHCCLQYIMTLIHTPRVLWSIGKGLKTNRDILKKVPPAATPTATAEVNNDADQASLLLSGILPEAPPHLYHGRAGLFGTIYDRGERKMQALSCQSFHPFHSNPSFVSLSLSLYPLSFPFSKNQTLIIWDI